MIKMTTVRDVAIRAKVLSNTRISGTEIFHLSPFLSPFRVFLLFLIMLTFGLIDSCHFLSATCTHYTP